MGSHNFLGVYDRNSVVLHDYTVTNGMVERSGGGTPPVYIFYANMGNPYVYKGTIAG